MNRTIRSQSRSPVRADRSRPFSARSTRNSPLAAGMSSQIKTTFMTPGLITPTSTGNQQSVHSLASPNACPVAHELLMTITLEPGQVTPLQQLLKGTCGDQAAFIRAEPVARSEKIQVLLSLKKTIIDSIMHTVMCGLPSAEFGRITQA